MKYKMTFLRIIRGGVRALFLLPLGTVTLLGGYVGDFSGFAEKGGLPIYFQYEVEGVDTFSQGKQVLGEDGLKIAFAKDRHGTFSGVVPSVLVESSEQSWKISTTVTFDWYGSNSLPGAYPAGGMVVFSGKKDYISLAVVHNGTRENDFVEIRSVIDGQNIRINGFNDPFVGDTSREYILTIEQEASGRIIFGYSDGGRSGVLLVLDENGGITEQRAGLVHADGTAFSGEPDYSKQRDFLSNLSGKQVGLFVDGHLYGVENPDTFQFSAIFEDLTVRGLKVANAHE